MALWDIGVIPFEVINRAALAQYPQLLHDWLPAGKVKGHEFLVGDVRGAPGKSFKVNVTTGAWADFAGIEKGGDPVSLAAAIFYNNNQGKAAHELARQLGISSPDVRRQQQEKPKEKWDPIMPPPPFADAPDLHGYDKVYTYRDQSGEPLFYIRRKEASGNARKLFTPLTYGTFDGNSGWHSKHPLSPRPLYGLEKLSRKTRVILCEGEKAADAAQELFHDLICMSWSGGTNSVKSADWSVLRGRDVVIWPDNDEPGAKAAAELQSILCGIAATISTLHVDDLPEKSDAADIIPDDPIGWLNDRLSVKDDSTPLPLVMFDDIEPCLDVRDFVQGVLVEEGAAVVYGESNAGKTFWTTDLALHVAAGLEWNGKRVEQGGVIYCVLEGGAGFRNRVTAWRTSKYLDGSNIPFAAVPAGLNLLDPEADTPKLIATIQAAASRMAVPIKLVVIDTLSRAMAGGNENAPDDMGALVMNMDAIRSATKASVLFVHHSGKDAAKGARGHSLLRAAVDTEIEVVASPEGDDKSATVVKQRELKKGDVFSFKLTVSELGQNRHGEAVTTCIVQPVEAAEKKQKSRISRLNTNAELGIRALDIAMSKRGALLPPTSDYPKDTVAVQTSVWRTEFYELKAGSMDTNKHSFSRAETDLLAASVITTNNGLTWKVQK